VAQSAIVKYRSRLGWGVDGKMNIVWDVGVRDDKSASAPVSVIKTFGTVEPIS
jgi:hypothetical protein